MGRRPDASVFAGRAGRWVPESRPLADAAQAAGDRLATMHIVGRGTGGGGFWTGRYDEAKRGGDPWVGREAPVSSVDPAVTEAALHAGVSW